MNCTYCKKEFSSKGNLTSHQKTAKYCLNIQGKQPNKILKCQGCKKEFLRISDLNRHNKICSSNDIVEVYKNKILFLESENNILREKVDDRDMNIEKLEDKITHLEDKLENLALKAMSRSSRVQDTERPKRINNLIPLTDEHIIDMCQHFDLEYIKRGLEGYVFFALEAVFKDRIYCSDFSRRKFVYKNPEGDMITDKCMVKLARKFFRAIEKINTKNLEHQTSMLEVEINNLSLDPKYNNISEENSILEDEFNNESRRLNELIIRYINQRKAVSAIAAGHFPDFLAQFVREVCNKLS